MIPGVIEYLLIVILVAASIMFLPPVILYWLSFTSIVTIEYTSFWKLAFFCWLAICLSNLVKRILWNFLSGEIFTYGITLLFTNIMAIQVADSLISSVSVSTGTILGLAVALTLGTVIEKAITSNKLQQTD